MQPTKILPTLVLIVMSTVIASPAQTYKILVSLSGSTAYPENALVQGIDGNLYGALHNPFGNLAIYRVTTAGEATVVTMTDVADGYFPALTQAPNGDFYGTNAIGGPEDAGTIFEVTPTGTLTTLHNFSTQGNDGSYPGPLILASNGNFYGTTAAGGTSGYGTIFEMTPQGKLHTVLTLDNTNGGAANSLLQGRDGNFYGTTYLGGLGNYGTVFKLTPGGTLTTLHGFDSTDGAGPYGGLVQGTDGNFYGVTLWGGDLTCNASTGCGTVYKVTPSGALTTLHNFEISDGLNPYTALIQATDGNFYGTTYYGGSDQQGTIFEITPAGALTTLYSFGEDGGNPFAPLVQDTNGSLYGTTQFGGEEGIGTIYVLSAPSLRPFVRTLPASGDVGSTVDILGSNLTGAISVSFNGTSAAFTVVSATEITATVPTGATTGMLKVTTPSGSWRSNVAFQVVP